MSFPQPATASSKPIVIYRGLTRDGATYALEAGSRTRLKQVLGGRAHLRSRVFIAHETSGDHGQVLGEIAPQVVMLLTGVAEAELVGLGGVRFLDAESERDLPRAES